MTHRQLFAQWAQTARGAILNGGQWQLVLDARKVMADILGANQNADCGGDGSFTPGTWQRAKDCLDALTLVVHGAETLDAALREL